MANYFRKQKEKEWQKQVDISLLFKIREAAKDIRNLVNKKKQEEGERLKEFLDKVLRHVESIDCAFDVIDGKVIDFDLRKHLMPPDQPEGYREIIELPEKSSLPGKRKSSLARRPTKRAAELST